MKNLSYENLTFTNYDEANQWYELQFEKDGETTFIRVDEKDHPEAKTDEFYFDNKELVEKIIKEAE